MSRPASRLYSIGLALLAATAAGCDWIPVRRRVDPSLYPVRSRKIDAPDLARTGPPRAVAPDEAPLPPLPVLTPFTEAEIASVTAPTPLLDEALARATLVEEATREAIEDEPPPPEPPRPVLQMGDPQPAPPLILETIPPALDPPLAVAPPPLAALPPFDPNASKNPLDAPAAPASSPISDDPAPGPETGAAVPGILHSVLQLIAQPNDADESTTGDEQPLRILDVRFCSRVDGFRRFVEADPLNCRPGQEILLYVEVQGVHYAFRGAAYESDLELALELIDARTGQIVWRDDHAVQDHTTAPIADYFANYRGRLPDQLAAGRYRVRLRLSDLRTHAHSERELALGLPQ